MSQPIGRRTVLGVGAATALAGCTGGTLSLPDPAPDPDRTVVVAALAACRETLALIDAVADGRPARRRALAATEDVHRQHVALLERAVPELGDTARAVPRIPRDDAAAYALVARQEDRLARGLRRACLQAESGAFARVLAGMAAASAQQAAGLRSL